MSNRAIILFSLTVWISVSCLSGLWEFVLEDDVFRYFGISDSGETYQQHLHFVVTVVVFTGLSLVVSTLVLMRLNRQCDHTRKGLIESERKFNRIMSAAPAGIYLKDKEGRFLYANPAYLKWTGYEGDIVGKTDFDVFPLDLAMNYDVQDRKILSAQTERNFETERKDEGGETEYLNIIKFPVFDRHGDIVGMGGIYSDISERKRAEQTVVKAMDALAKANQAKSKFLAHMSHELRTPLTAILGFSKMMAEKTFGPLGAQQYEEYADIINSSGLHLLDMINDVLDLSKIEAGKLEAQTIPLNVEEIIAGSLAVVRSQAIDSGMNFYTEVSENLPYLLADPRMVKQMLLNLLSNALKYSPEDGNISVVAGQGPEGGIQISVTDNGMGIEPANLPKLLEPYARIATDDREQTQGTGLGLPLVSELLKLHRGELKIDSKVGVGTTMTLCFPPDSTQRYGWA